MNHKELAEKVALLKAGQLVEIDGLWFSARRIAGDYTDCPCCYCNVDCMCRGDVTEVCAELDLMSKSKWCLYLKS